MERNRYAEWIAVWEWFQNAKTHEVIPREKWDELYHLLDDMWQEERRNATPEELAAHAGALANLQRWKQ